MKLFHSLFAALFVAAVSMAVYPPDLRAAPATEARVTQSQTGTIISVPMAASTTLYHGTLAAINASGYAVTAADTAGLRVIGVVEGTVTNDGAAGEASVKIVRGVFKFNNSGTNAVDVADVGMAVFIEDNQTLADASTNAISAGLCVKLDADGVWVETRLPAPPLGTPSVTVANAGTPDGNATVTIQMRDATGQAVAGRALVQVWFAATAFAAPADLGTLTASSGVILKEDTDDALATCVTSSTGSLVLVLDTISNGTVHAHASASGPAGTSSAAITGN